MESITSRATDPLDRFDRVGNAHPTRTSKLKKWPDTFGVRSSESEVVLLTQKSNALIASAHFLIKIALAV